MYVCNQIVLSHLLLASLYFGASQADDHPDWADDHHDTTTESKGPHPKDRILLKEVKKLTFIRNKRTSSRRTHSIHQLSCVGGTAGCKLFTPDTVECENVAWDPDRFKPYWKCHAEIGDRVTFNHVEVICEGYDYPEDDFILVGSCGLEFTLDYTDPHDYHHNSYFKHMDEHEKELHQERVRATAGSRATKESHGYFRFIGLLMSNLNHNSMLVGLFFVLALCSYLVVKCLDSTGAARSLPTRKATNQRNSYGPLTSAVLTTKKVT